MLLKEEEKHPVIREEVWAGGNRVTEYDFDIYNFLIWFY